MHWRYLQLMCKMPRTFRLYVQHDVNFWQVNTWDNSLPKKYLSAWVLKSSGCNSIFTSRIDPWYIFQVKYFMYKCGSIPKICIYSGTREIRIGFLSKSDTILLNSITTMQKYLPNSKPAWFEFWISRTRTFRERFVFLFFWLWWLLFLLLFFPHKEIVFASFSCGSLQSFSHHTRNTHSFTAQIR